MTVGSDDDPAAQAIVAMGSKHIQKSVTVSCNEHYHLHRYAEIAGHHKFAYKLSSHSWYNLSPSMKIDLTRAAYYCTIYLSLVLIDP